MKVLLLNQYFHPDIAATATLATDLAVDLAAAGLEVTALATRGDYRGGARLPPGELYRGVRIVRVSSTGLGRASTVARLADYGSFFAGAAARLASAERPDVVIAMSTPPLVALLGSAMRAKGARFVYWAQDVYPDLAVELGVLGAKSVPARLLRRIARSMIRGADAVVVPGEVMGERLRRAGAPAERLHVVPNWADGRKLAPVDPSANPVRGELARDGRPLVMYSGNLGKGHDVETLIALARAMSREARFVFVGGGAGRQALDGAERDGLVSLLPYAPAESLARSLSAADVHLVSQDPRTLGLIEPSKLYGIMAVGRPVLYVGPQESQVARTVEKEGIGRVVANGDVKGAVDGLRALIAAAPVLGPRARAAFLARYDRVHRTAQLLAVLRSL